MFARSEPVNAVYGNLKTTGTSIDNIMPPVSRFGGARTAKKQAIIEKLMKFFEKYSGLA